MLVYYAIKDSCKCRFCCNFRILCFRMTHPVYIFVLIILSNLESTKIFLVNYFLTNGLTVCSTENGDYWRDLLGSYKAIESNIECFSKRLFEINAM